MKKMKFKCYDTCSLLEQAGHLFDNDDFTLVITSITLEELEHIKTASNKDADIWKCGRCAFRTDKEVSVEGSKFQGTKQYRITYDASTDTGGIGNGWLNLNNVTGKYFPLIAGEPISASVEAVIGSNCKGIRIIIASGNDTSKTQTICEHIRTKNDNLGYDVKVKGTITANFTTDKAYTNAKVMVWNDLMNFTPICDVETIE